jgi:4-amino-4-deoxy-L-arabinose transferase-like glycosyltransferase
VRQGLSQPFWLALVTAAFCLPLFIGLGLTDVENDEAIYSFAVDGILANGDWLNPRSSPDADAIFLEKPPLKFWIVAAPIALGWLPHNEVGLRAWDALFAAISFLYVFALGARLAGPVCGVIAVMVLFVHRPLLFEHGVRGNNMEAPLFLCYCGGMFHFVAWGTAGDAWRRGWHVFAVAGYFFLGFMTKFVAAFFLPVVVVACLAALPSTRRRMAEDWRLWATAAALFVVAASPWFVYQHLRQGALFWQIIFGTHVVTRFTSYLDPAHLNPWNYYYVTIWRDLQHGKVGWLLVVGFALTAVSLFRQRRLETVAVLAWLAIPLALMSIATSKLPHYAYPFLPPFALLVGSGPGWLVSTGRPYVEAAMAAMDRAASGGPPAVIALQRVLLVLSAVALLVAGLTLVTGGVHWRIGELQVLRNSQVLRPLAVALVLAALAGRGRQGARLILPMALLVVVAPLDAYEATRKRLRVENHPVRSVRDCMMGERTAEIAAGRTPPGVYAIGEGRWFLHHYFYYLHHLGGWERAETMGPGPLASALFEAGRQRPVLIGEDDYRAFKVDHAEALRSVPILTLRGVLLLLPGPYARCGSRPAGSGR